MPYIIKLFSYNALAVKNAEGSFVFDVNEIFEGHTALDIVSQSLNPEKEKYVALIKKQNGVSYNVLKELFLENAKAVSPKTKDAIIAWEVKLRRFELLKEAYRITRNFLNIPLVFKARTNAIHFLNETIEKLGQRKNYSLRDLQYELKKILTEFDDLDREIYSRDPSLIKSTDPCKYALMCELLENTYNKYKNAQSEDKVILLKEEFIKWALQIKNTTHAQIVTVFCKLTQAKARTETNQHDLILEQGRPHFS